MTTYICDECGYQAAERAQVLAHLRAEHGIVDAGEVGQVAQHDGLLILREGGQETVIDLDAWVRLAGGLVCVPARWPDCYPADEAV